MLPAAFVHAALTRLTALQLHHMDSALDDAACMAIAAKLTGLQQLVIQEEAYSIISDGTLAVLQQMPLLTQLVVNGEEAVLDGNQGGE